MQLRAMLVVVPLACVLTPIFNALTVEVSVGSAICVRRSSSAATR
jgi:hypothetical protein